MTTVEFAQHLVGYCRFHDAAEASAAEGQELALIMSAATEEWFDLAPSMHQRTTVTSRQEAPETIEVEIQDGASSTVGAPFPVAKRGSTVFIGNDPRPNEITGPSTLLYAYRGDSGTVSAVIYHNCITFPDFLVQRCMTPPEVVRATGQVTQLNLFDSFSRTSRRPTYDAQVGGMVAAEASVSLQRAEVPTAYWFEAIGGSHQVEVDGVFQIRLWPLATTECQIQLDVAVLPLAYRLADVTTPRLLPVPDSLAHRTLVPLARALLADSWIFDNDRHAKRASQLSAAGEKARQAIRDLPTTWEPSQAMVGTPGGW